MVRIQHYEKYIKNSIIIFYYFTLFLSIAGNIGDLLLLSNDGNFLFYTNITNILILIISLLLVLTRSIKYPAAYHIVAISTILNILVSPLLKMGNDIEIFIIFRDTLFLALFMTMTSFLLSKIYSIIVPIAFSIMFLVLSINDKNPVVIENAPILILVMLTYGGLIYFFVTLLYRVMNELSEKNMIVKTQLEEITTQNEELLEHRELIITQRDSIENVNRQLIENYQELADSKEELAKVNKTKDKFFSIIAHDLKGPFNTILGFSQLLLKNYTVLSDEKRLKYIDFLHRSSISVFNLLNNLLEWSRSQTNSIQFNPEEINIKDLIDEIYGLLKGQFNNKSMKFKVSLNQVGSIMADRNMLTTILRNLISNSIKFSVEGGIITVDISKSENEYIIKVIDTGIGMEESVASTLFNGEGFISTEGTKGESGTGLGLLICNEFVKKHGGKITIISALGQGTTFTFTIPYSFVK